jgi:hypothetical protein
MTSAASAARRCEPYQATTKATTGTVRAILLIVIVTAEMEGVAVGLGYMVLETQQTFQTNEWAIC